MKKNKRIWAGLLAAVMASSMMLTGCGGDKAADADTSAAGTSDAAGQTDKDSADADSAAAPNTDSSNAGEQVTLKVMHNGPKPDGWDAVFQFDLDFRL